MKIIFRLNYHTVPGQSLWVKLATTPEGEEASFEQVLPMRWLNDKQWEAALNVRRDGSLKLKYRYQFRDERNGVALEEWGDERTVVADPAVQDALLLHDTWCCAGTVDYAYETAAFRPVFAQHREFAEAPMTKGANHTLQLHLAAVPDDLTPCVIGNVREIGDWGWHHVLPLTEVAPNVWRAHVYLPTDWRIEYKYGLMDLTLGCLVRMESGENRVLEPRVLAPRQWTIVSDEAYRRSSAELYRAAGVAIPVFSLRSAEGLGVGEFADLKRLGDWASGVGLKLIQILPINDTISDFDWSDSYPYSAISVFALHPLYLRIDDLGYAMPADFTNEVAAERDRFNPLDHVDYVNVMKSKLALTRRVFDAHRQAIIDSEGFRHFLDANREWLISYAVFCVKRDAFGTAKFSEWEDWAVFDRERVDAMADSGHPEWPEVAYYIWLQYELDRQLSDAVRHLRQRGIALKGDLPIGIDRESVEAWSAPHWFKMDTQAGAPPDAFAAKGQNWGFPTYDWDVMQKDGYAWWRARFAHLSRYFDAFRIDHILGFFRIWQVPWEQVEGIMGWFDPALPIHIDEIRGRGIPFDRQRFCQPYIREHLLWERFGIAVKDAKERFLESRGDGYYRLRDEVSTQRKIVEFFEELEPEDENAALQMERLREGLLDCVSDVLFFEVPGSDGQWFHPRCAMHVTRSYLELGDGVKQRMDELYMDYFFRRQESFWQARAYEKLPVMRRASPMLLCGEDLGMVPACVGGVLKELGILSLEIQRMPKRSGVAFSDPAVAPYMSVVSPSTHDMPTLRGWWREDRGVIGDFARRMLGLASPPIELSGEIAARIIVQHLESPAMWAVFPLQDLLAMDESLRFSDPDAERINVPANSRHHWRFRLHFGLEELIAADGFNSQVARMLRATGRVPAR